MTYLVIDPVNAAYLAHHASQGVHVAQTLEGALALIDSNPPYDKIIIASSLLPHVPTLVRRGYRVEVATASATVAEANEAYRARASDYYTKRLE